MTILYIYFSLSLSVHVSMTNASSFRFFFATKEIKVISLSVSSICVNIMGKKVTEMHVGFYLFYVSSALLFVSEPVCASLYSGHRL